MSQATSSIFLMSGVPTKHVSPRVGTTSPGRSPASAEIRYAIGTGSNTGALFDVDVESIALNFREVAVGWRWASARAARLYCARSRRPERTHG